jgi:hypothetical protein
MSKPLGLWGIDLVILTAIASISVAAVGITIAPGTSVTGFTAGLIMAVELIVYAIAAIPDITGGGRAVGTVAAGPDIAYVARPWRRRW